ncbi:MAG: DUF1203 domain-containing protein [Sphingomonas sp.]|nr:DUF1203 domain-containing protein [Sphingomonas sp.]
MIDFTITGLDPALFAPLYDLDDTALAKRNALRMMVTEQPGFPCRVTLEDAAVGERVLLLNHAHLPDGPYAQRHAIFVREGAAAAGRFRNTIPDQLAIRTLSVRAYDAAGMMTGADLVDGRDLEATIEQFFNDPAVTFLHAHNAKRGCFAARIDRG